MTGVQQMLQEWIYQYIFHPKESGIEGDLKERKDMEIPIEGFSGKNNGSCLGQRGEGLLRGKATQASASKPSRKDKSPQSCMQDKGMSGLHTLGSGQCTLAGLRQALESSPEGFTPG